MAEKHISTFTTMVGAPSTPSADTGATTQVQASDPAQMQVQSADSSNMKLASQTSSMKMESSSSQKSSSSTSSSMKMESSSKSMMQSSQTSSSTKTASTTSSKTVKTSSSKTTKSFSSKSISIKSSTSSFADSMGIDMGKEMEKLKLTMGEETQKARQQFLHLMPLESAGSANEVVKLDSNSIMSYVDKDHNDKLKFNFDVNEFQSESVSVKAVGNKIEVHAKKKVKKGDDETTEEYSRSYELPTANEIDSGNVTSSFFKDGVLQIEIPVAGAVEDKK